MAKVLENSLIEAFIVLGMDENTGLSKCKAFQRGFTDTFSHDNKGIMGPFQLHVLGILSGTTAVFPLAKSFVDGGPYYRRNNIFCPSVDTDSTKKERLRRSMSYASSAVETIPYSNEVIYSLATFCFPDGGYASQCRREPRILYLVLTNMEGDRSYASCLIFDRKFNSRLNDQNEDIIMKLDSCVEGDHINSNHTQYDGECIDEKSDSEEEDTIVYVPTGLCFVSKYPYFNVMRHCLSAFHAASCNSWEPILELSSQVFCLVVPPAGPVSVKFSIDGQSCVIPPADEPEQRPVDIELHWPFLFLSVENIVRVFCSILTQQRIIFLSSRYSMLTLVIESFFTYIEPFKWGLTYVPVLPNSLADLIEAPGPFIMGCHSSLKKQVVLVRQMEEIPGIVLVDLDERVVDIQKDEGPPKMPDMIEKALCIMLKRLKYLYDVEQIEQQKPRTFQEAIERRQNFNQMFAKEVRIAFLNAMVDLFGGTLALMRFSEKFFDRKSYLDSKLDMEATFYNVVCNTYAFDRFIDDRLENPERRDTFAVMSEKFYSSRKSVLQRKRSSSNVSTLPKKVLFTMTSLITFDKEAFKLPAFIKGNLSTGEYFQKCVDHLTHCIDSIGGRSVKVKASYYYLRGMMSMACNNAIRALEDFFSLYSLGEEMFPKEYVSDIMSSLSEAEQQQLQQEDFYKRTANFRKYLKKSEEQRARAASRRLPKAPIKKEEFINRVKTLQIALSDESADWLYRVITYNHTDRVTPEQFEFLYKTFFDNEKHLRSMDCLKISHGTEDKLLAISQLINSTKGMGRLVMTMNTLYFMAEGSRNMDSVICLHDIQEVIKFKHYVVFPPGVLALRIVNKDRSFAPFFACLKEERDLWVCLLNEMATGHESSFSYKDPQIIEIASNNVILANVIVKMGKSTKMAESVCTYSRSRDSEKDQLSEDTRESLERRLNPSECESRRATVMTVIYVPGRSLADSATLWCGMGSGLIVVYETASWTCISEIRHARSRIGCLLLVEDNYVWAGSYDSVIYVISADTRKSVQQLSKHSGFISDMIVSPDKTKTVWSASCSGQLLQWDINTCEPTREPIKLSGVTTLTKLIFASNKLWCVTMDAVLVVSPGNDVEILQRITATNENMSPASFENGCKLSEEKILIAGGRKGQLFEIYTDNYKIEEKKIFCTASFNTMVTAGDSVWIGCKDGEVLIIDPLSYGVLRELNAHTDVIKCMCVTREGHVVTGSSSGDGKLCIWNAEEKDRYESADSLGYEVVDGKRGKCSCK